jgi:hypothetical protein
LTVTAVNRRTTSEGWGLGESGSGYQYMTAVWPVAKEE